MSNAQQVYTSYVGVTDQNSQNDDRAIVNSGRIVDVLTDPRGPLRPAHLSGTNHQVILSQRICPRCHRVITTDFPFGLIQPAAPDNGSPYSEVRH